MAGLPSYWSKDYVDPDTSGYYMDGGNADTGQGGVLMDRATGKPVSAAPTWHDGPGYQDQMGGAAAQNNGLASGGSQYTLNGATAYDPTKSGRNMIDPTAMAQLKAAGWTGGDPFVSASGANPNSMEGAMDGGKMSPQFVTWLRQSGIQPQAVDSGDGTNLTFIGPNGQQVASTHVKQMDSKEFMYAAMAAGVFATAGAMGAAMGGEGAAGAGLNSSMGAQAIEGASGAAGAAGEAAGADAALTGTITGGAGGAGAGTTAGVTAGTAAPAAGGAGAGSGLMGTLNSGLGAVNSALGTSLNWGQIVGAAGSLYSAAKKDQSTTAATNAQTDSIETQKGITSNALSTEQEQWNQQRNTWDPALLQAAKDNSTTQATVASNDLATSKMLGDNAAATIDQAKKSWKYQDEYMAMTDDYTSGRAANVEADKANADVEQGYAGAQGQMNRNAARYGINPGSGAFAGAMSDMYNEKALASAGAQTNARRMARDKAEQMVGVAAGSGAAGFGQGISMANGSTGANAGATAAGTSGVNGWANADGAATTGANSAYAGLGLASNSNLGLASTGSGLAKNASGSATADALSGIGTGVVKSGVTPAADATKSTIPTAPNSNWGIPAPSGEMVNQYGY